MLRKEKHLFDTRLALPAGQVGGHKTFSLTLGTIALYLYLAGILLPRAFRREHVLSDRPETER